MALPALLSHEDLVKFRTRFCERYLSYGECNFGGKCQYSHNMLWRRRSPQKHAYEPRLCENVLIWVGANGKRQVSINCHLGKNCRFAHSREEVLYHPSVYKTLMCESARCTRYYCPFAHAVNELQQSPDGLDYVRSCMGAYREQRELFTDDSGSDDDNEEDFSVDSLFGANCSNQCHNHSPGYYGASNQYPNPYGPSPVSPQQPLRLRKASIGSTSSMMAPRLSFSNTDWTESSSGLTNSWVTVTPTLKVETVVRAHSPVVGSELCRAVIVKPGNSNNSRNNGNTTQQALAKVMQISEEGQDALYVQMSNELQSLCRSEHKNILTIKKVHAGRVTPNQQTLNSPNTIPLSNLPPSSGNTNTLNSSHTNPSLLLVIAFEQCSTSLYQLVVDGYRGFGFDGKVKSVARRLNPHDGTLTATAVSKIGDLISAVQRLHFIGVSHLRICPTNILVDSEAGFKLADFLGKWKLVSFLEKPRKDYAHVFLQDVVAVWLAPEILHSLIKAASPGHGLNSSQLTGAIQTSQPHPTSSVGIPLQSDDSNVQNIRVNSKRCDIYALGLSIFFAMTGQHLFGTFVDEERLAAAGSIGCSADTLFTQSVASQSCSNSVESAHTVHSGHSHAQETHGIFSSSGTSHVVQNMLNGISVNQYLLYDVPLVLDLVFRMTAREGRFDAMELSRHPLFWDFAQTAGFLSSLPVVGPSHGKGSIFRAFCEYGLNWETHLNQEERVVITRFGGVNIEVCSSQPAGNTCSSGVTQSSPPTQQTKHVIGLLQALQSVVLTGDPRLVGPVVLRILQRHPLVLIRAWDALRVEAALNDQKQKDELNVNDENQSRGNRRKNSLSLAGHGVTDHHQQQQTSQSWERYSSVYGEIFGRPNLDWMEGKRLSAEFVREYYNALLSGVMQGLPYQSSVTPEQFFDKNIPTDKLDPQNNSTEYANGNVSFSMNGLVTSGMVWRESLPQPPSHSVPFALPPSFSLTAGPSGVTLDNRPPPIIETTKPITNNNVWQPPVQTPKGLVAPTVESIRQVAAASAALATVHENPAVVPVLAASFKGILGDAKSLLRGEEYSEKLLAAAAIYSNLLNSNFSIGDSLFDPRGLKRDGSSSVVSTSTTTPNATATYQDDDTLFLQQEKLAEQLTATLTQDNQ